MGLARLRPCIALTCGACATREQAHWFEKEQLISKAYRSRIVVHRHLMEAICRKMFRYKTLLPSWNTWYGLLIIKRAKESLRAQVSGQDAPVKATGLRRERVRRRWRQFSGLTNRQLMHQVLLVVASSPGLEKFIAGMVVASVVLMGMQGSCDSKLGRVLGCTSNDRTSFLIFAAVIEALLLATTCIFIVEALLKLYAFGPRRYLANFGNLFDFVLAVVALTEVVAVGEQLNCQIQAVISGQTTQEDTCAAGTSSAQALRALRLVRLARLLRRFPAMRKVGMTITYTVVHSWGALALCVLAVTVGSIMGFVLLGGKIYDLVRPWEAVLYRLIALAPACTRARVRAV